MNTMTVKEKCFCHNIENLRQPNEKQYLKNKKYFVDLNIFSFFKKNEAHVKKVLSENTLRQSRR